MSPASANTNFPSTEQKMATICCRPGWSYWGPTSWQVGTNETVLYDTRDITAQIQPGTTNAIGLIFGNSFYNVTDGYGRYVKFTQSFGPLRAIAQVRLDYTNGTTQIIGSDANWLTGPGAISFENVYAGEDYDARLEPTGWNQTGYTNAEWTPAVLTNGPGGILKGLSCAAPPVGKFDVFTPSIQPTDRSISWNENNSNTVPSTGRRRRGARHELEQFEHWECRWQTIPALLLARVFQLLDHGGLGKSRRSAARMLTELTTADSLAATPTHRQSWTRSPFHYRHSLFDLQCDRLFQFRYRRAHRNHQQRECRPNL